MTTADAATLGAARAITGAVFFISALFDGFTNLGRLPITLLRPAGFMQLLPWRLFELVLTPRGMFVLTSLMLLSLAASTLGLWTRWTTKTSAVLVLFYQGLGRSLGHYNHDEMLGVYFLCVLAFTPCGDAFSLDSLRRRTRARMANQSFVSPATNESSVPGAAKESFAYGYPVLLLRSLLAWTYFSSALIKLRLSGLSYFSPDTLPTLAIYHSLDNLHDTAYRYAFALSAYRPYTSAAVALVFLWELLFPLAIFSRRARLFLLGFGVVFHISTIFLLNVFFWHLLPLYLVFVDWGAAFARLRLTRAHALLVARFNALRRAS